MSVFSVIGSIAVKVWGIGKVLLPILEAFRAASPAVDDALDKVEDILEEGGEVADDFLDRNLRTLEDMREFFQDMQAAGVAGQAFMEQAITYSQVESPDQLTPAEAQTLAVMLPHLKDTLRALVTREDLGKALASMS